MATPSDKGVLSNSLRAEFSQADAPIHPEGPALAPPGGAIRPPAPHGPPRDAPPAVASGSGAVSQAGGGGTFFPAVHQLPSEIVTAAYRRVVNVYKTCQHLYEADTRTYHEAMPAGVHVKHLDCACPNCGKPPRRLPERPYDQLP